jgi:hypothetical protein
MILQARIKRFARYTLFNEGGGLPLSSPKTSLCILSISGVGASSENTMADIATGTDLKYLNRAAGTLNNFVLG